MRPSLRLAAFTASLVTFVWALPGCERKNSDHSSHPDETVATDQRATDHGDGEAGVGASEEDGAQAVTVGQDLPAPLLGAMRLQGADADGRLLTIGAGFVATAACSDCGAPSYLRLLAVRCSDERHCEILTEQCEGKISRSEDEVMVALAAVEGVEPQVCADYNGTFVPAAPVE
ncbi:MAG: hypothetical protein KC457_04925 [Myxococcales bacterium]|nr:hypothetical protein [Myxococcales bacterium]